MFKIVFLLVSLYAVLAVARPSYVHSVAHPAAVLPATYETSIAYEPTVIGHTYESLPTAISHQSQTIVHEKRPYLRPIVQHTPILKSYSPVGLSYAAPLSYDGWYEPGWSGSALSAAYPTIYIK